MDVSDDADRLQTLLYSSYSADVVRQLERPLLDDGVPLMRMAASAVARVTLSLLDDEDLDVEDARVTVLAGAGDNGGDGLYAGAELAREGAQVTAVAVGRSLHEDAFRAFVRAGGRVLVLDRSSDRWPYSPESHSFALSEMALMSPERIMSYCFISST